MTENSLLEEYKTIYGFEDMSLINLDSKLVEYIYKLSLLDIDSSLSTWIKSSKVYEMNLAKEFLVERFNLRFVHLLDEKELQKLNGLLVGDINELIAIYNQLGRDVNCFEIPISFIKANPLYGVLVQHLNICDDRIFLEKMKLYINKIKLSKQMTCYTGMCYVHELIHTQLSLDKSMIKDYKNGEIISIFLELVYLFEGPFDNKQLKEIFISRINYLILEFYKLFKYYYENDNQILMTEALVSSKYVVSIIKAFNLFLLYYNNIGIRKEILEYIQKVIDYNICLEDFLNKYELSFDKCIEETDIASLLKIL